MKTSPEGNYQLNILVAGDFPQNGCDAQCFVAKRIKEWMGLDTEVS